LQMQQKWLMNLQPHQMWVTKWLWFFVNTKTILNVLYRLPLLIFTCCYCWSIFKWKRSAEECRIAAHTEKWDICFHCFLFLVLCGDELCSQCLEISEGVFMVKLEGWYLLSCVREFWVLWWVLRHVPPTHEQGMVARRGRKWQQYNGNKPHKASIRAAQSLSSVMESLCMHMQWCV